MGDEGEHALECVYAFSPARVEDLGGGCDDEGDCGEVGRVECAESVYCAGVGCSERGGYVHECIGGMESKKEKGWAGY